MKKTLSLVLSLCLIFLFATPAAASQGTKTVSITYRGISLTLDGQPIIPVDAEGHSVEPFLLDGTTYLPVRGVANALDLDVAWDGKTSTVTLTSGGTSVAPVETAKATQGTISTVIAYRDITIILDGTILTPVDAAGNTVEPFILNGTTYLPVRAISEALNLTVTWDGTTSTVILASEGYTPLTQDIPDDSNTQKPGGNGSVSEQETSDPGQSEGRYVGSTQSDKFHYATCQHAKKILSENKIWFETREDAFAKGYSPCGVCKP